MCKTKGDYDKAIVERASPCYLSIASVFISLSLGKPRCLKHGDGCTRSLSKIGNG